MSVFLYFSCDTVNLKWFGPSFCSLWQRPGRRVRPAGIFFLFTRPVLRWERSTFQVFSIGCFLLKLYLLFRHGCRWRTSVYQILALYLQLYLLGRCFSSLHEHMLIQLYVCRVKKDVLWLHRNVNVAWMWCGEDIRV